MRTDQRIRGRRRAFSLETLEARELLAAPDVLHPIGKLVKAREGRGFTATVATFQTSDRSATPKDYQVSINWGDGVTTAGIVARGPGRGHFTIKGKHSYDNGETQVPITVDVQPQGGAVVEITTRAKVSGITAAFIPVPETVNEGDTVSNMIVGQIQLVGRSRNLSLVSLGSTVSFPTALSPVEPEIQGAAGGKGLYNVIVPSYTAPEQTSMSSQASVDLYLQIHGARHGDVLINSQSPFAVQEVERTWVPTPISEPVGTVPTSQTSIEVGYFTDSDALTNHDQFLITVTTPKGTKLDNIDHPYGVYYQIQPGANGASPVVAVYLTPQGIANSQLFNSITTSQLQVVVQEEISGSNGAAASGSITGTTSLTVFSSLSLEMVSGAYEVVGGPPPPPPPDSNGMVGYIFGFNPPGAGLPQYQITINWGDGTTTTNPSLYPAGPLYPMSGEGANDTVYGIAMTHMYTTGGSPDEYDIKVTITGPGIPAAKPITGTAKFYVFCSTCF